MASVVQNHENLRKQLAVAVRSVQWSYAVFWSLSTTKQGVLNWGSGSYNGDVKTRKSFQTMDSKADKMGLQRSEQLKELYESLLEDGRESEPQSTNTSPALSPEDLSDAEWYYMVCMSFVFNPGQCLPGRALANNQTIWLCDAQHADSQVFSRSLLAKSASIQTILCFPYLGGVIELGVTDLVSEDSSLVQHIKASLLHFSKPMCSENSSSPHNEDFEIDPRHEIVELMALENISTNENIRKEFEGASLDDCSDGSELNLQTDDFSFMENDFSNYGFQGSVNSSDCLSQIIINQERMGTFSKLGNFNIVHHFKNVQECNDAKFSSMDIGSTNDDLHYRNILSTVLGSSNRLSGNLLLQGSNCKSSFVRWKKTGSAYVNKHGVQQGLLKKMLYTVPLMLGDWSRNENGGKIWLWKEDNNNDARVHLSLPDKAREHEKFMVLKSMIPSTSKIDKEAILNDTIRYVQALEARMEKLEFSIDLTEFERKKRQDNVEHTSDNYDEKKVDNNGNRPNVNKRKACDLQPSLGIASDGLSSDMKVRVKEDEVLIELRCAWREYVLVEIIDAMNNLCLDTHSVLSSTQDGVFTLVATSKFRGEADISARMIKHALEKVTSSLEKQPRCKVLARLHKFDG